MPTSRKILKSLPHPSLQGSNAGLIYRTVLYTSSFVYITLSIGIVIYPEHGRTLDELLKSADIAMYKAKENGRNNFVIYDYEMNKDFTERVNIEKHLHLALQDIYCKPT
jgi:predicted signal transduction protein with EAL and GGDEF domain